MSKSDIDFVVLWVNPNDKLWQQELKKAKNNNDSTQSENEDERFRDFDTIKYFFRSVELYAPWVNNIYFVTCGHVPTWLDTECSKLKIVKHSDFIPEEYLPTFNSNTIELNLHRIKTLSEKFVLFNDDFMLTNKVSPSYFFKKNLPNDFYVETPMIPIADGDIFNIIFNNMKLINSEFKDKRHFILSNFNKVFNLRYGSLIIRSLVMSLWSNYSNFYSSHVSQPYLKSKFVETWAKYPKQLNDSCLNTFRSANDLNHWLIRIRQILSGEFNPMSIKSKKYLSISNIAEDELYLYKHAVKEVCLNDSDVDNFLETNEIASKILKKKYPKISSFERNGD